MKTMRSLKWLRPLLVVLFMSYYVGGTAFTHTHHFLNYSITHSHPYLPGADGLFTNLLIIYRIILTLFVIFSFFKIEIDTMHMYQNLPYF